MKFIRFGGLSSVNQKGYNPLMPGFHSPPARKGIYVFPVGCIVPFLLGGDRPTSKGSVRYVRDKDGNKISSEDNDDLYTNYKARPYTYINGVDYYPDRNFYKVYSTKKARDGKYYWVRPSTMKTFDYPNRSELWHHLEHQLKPYQILNRIGSWVLSNTEDFEKALYKEESDLRHASASGMALGVNSVKKFGYYSMDHVEAFIEEVKKEKNGKRS